MKTINFDTGNRAEENRDPDAKSDVEDLKSKLASYFKSMKKEWLISSSEFGNAGDSDNERFMKHNENMEVGSGSNDEQEGESENRNDDVMSYLGNVMSSLGEIAKSGVEKEYIVEYAMDKFTYVTSKTTRDHYFDKGEVEYLLWGDDSQATNITLTMGSVWFLRFAINSIDSFATSPVCEPISRLITSIVKGFVLSCYDMIELYQGKDIGICPSLNGVKINYSDHLRLFLLLKMLPSAGEESVLNNMRQLIQVNEKQNKANFQLKNYFTALSCKAEVKINLWLLPMFQLDKLNLKNFKDDKYIITKETNVGY